MVIGVNGIQLYYTKTGQGRPLIMVHGNGEDHTIFDEAVSVLKEHFTCYCIDSRGHGQSSPCKELHYKDMAGDMIAFMSELDLNDAAFYGFSDGGIVALLAAMDCSRITNLVVSGANITTKGTTWPFRLFLKVSSFVKYDPLIELMKNEPDIAPEELPLRDTAAAHGMETSPEEHDWSFIERCEDAGITVSIGHTAATYEMAAAAVQQHGVHHFTHLFNAMTGLHHRRPGTVGAALDTDARVELICDNIHIAPAVQRLVWRLKGAAGLILVTDSMSACGIGDGTYTFGGHEVTVRGERATLADGTIAASIATLNRCIERFQRNTGAPI